MDLFTRSHRIPPATASIQFPKTHNQYTKCFVLSYSLDVDLLFLIYGADTWRLSPNGRNFANNIFKSFIWMKPFDFCIKFQSRRPPECCIYIMPQWTGSTLVNWTLGDKRHWNLFMKIYFKISATISRPFCPGEGGWDKFIPVDRIDDYALDQVKVWYKTDSKRLPATMVTILYISCIVPQCYWRKGVTQLYSFHIWILQVAYSRWF